MRLFAHPASPPAYVDAVTVSGEVGRGVTELVYRVAGDVRMASVAGSARADDLWQHTCFELFVKPVGGEGYFEFNFAPSTQWAAYGFEGYRAGRADLDIPAPAIERLDDGVRVTVDLGVLPAGEWQVGVNAVIEEMDRTISYWALAHPPGKADFHDPACFALKLPAANAP